MSDWAVGDLAVCVDASAHCCGRITHTGEIITEGTVIRVSGVRAMSCGCVCLEDGIHVAANGFGPLARRFRKIRPDQHSGSIEDWNDILKVHRKKAPSEGERTKRIIEALFAQSPTERAGAANNRSGDTHGD